MKYVCYKHHSRFVQSPPGIWQGPDRLGGSRDIRHVSHLVMSHPTYFIAYPIEKPIKLSKKISESPFSAVVTIYYQGAVSRSLRLGQKPFSKQAPEAEFEISLPENTILISFNLASVGHRNASCEGATAQEISNIHLRLAPEQLCNPH